MKARSRWLVAGAIALASGALVWIARPTPPAAPSPVRLEHAQQRPAHPTQPAPKTSVRAEPPKAAPSVVAPMAKPESESALPDWRVPLDQAIPLLRAAADAGDTTAQIELSIRLGACTKAALRAATAMDENDRSYIENAKGNKGLTDEQRERNTAMSQSRIDANAAARRACEALPQDLRAHWLDSLERAAASGSLDAKLTYARLAVSEYDTVDAIIADVDEAIRRRDKARAYLLDVLDAGDFRSFRELSDAYSSAFPTTPHLFPPDAVKTYAYAYAGLLAGAITPPSFDWMMANNGEPLDASRLAQAQAEGRRLYERCCVKH